MDAPAALVAQTVREADPDRYVATLYAPEDKRAALFALYAFNAEVAGIRDRIREPLPGEIRLQWWRDVLAGGEHGADGHPVAVALLEAVERFRLPHEAFDNYLEARRFDLYDDPMPSRADLEGYCGETASALIQLASLVLDPQAASAHSEAAGHAGCAQAIAGLLRALPVHRRRGQCYVPRDILDAAGTSAAGFVAGSDQPADIRAIDAMAALAREHLAAFEKAAVALQSTLRPAYLPLALAGGYLKAVARRGDGAKRADIAPWTRHWRMLRAAISGW